MGDALSGEYGIIKKVPLKEGVDLMAMKLDVGDIVQTKKKHPCGEDRWELLRVGIDFKMRCMGCGRLVEIPRTKLEKRIKQIEKRTDANVSDSNCQ